MNEWDYRIERSNIRWNQVPNADFSYMRFVNLSGLISTFFENFLSFFVVFQTNPMESSRSCKVLLWSSNFFFEFEFIWIYLLEA